MKIESLKAKNFKRINEVVIHPNGMIVVDITGRNRSGKSSVLDFIEWAIVGPKSGVEAPLRNGAKVGGGTLDLGELKIDRSIDADGKHVLKVTTAAGAKVPDGQTVLNKLFGAISFDAVAFGQLSDKDRAETLRKLVGIDTRLMDEERAQLFAERTIVNREIKAHDANIAAMKIPPAPDVVPAEIDLAKFSDAKAQIVAVNAANAAKRQAAATAKERATAWAAEVLKRRAALVESEAKSIDANRTADAAAYEAAACEDKPTSGIDAEIDAAKTHNATCRVATDAMRLHKDAALAYRKKADERGEASRKTDLLSERINAIDAEKQRMLTTAEFPYPGMGFEGDVVTVDGVPYGALSQSDWIKVGLSMGRALNKGLDIALIRRGSDLDDDGLRDVDEWAEANGVQVWRERVAHGDPVGICLVDGMVQEVVDKKR